MRLLVFDADHVYDNKSVIRLFCKDEKGKTVLVLDQNFEPYFYVEPREGKLQDYKKKLLSHDFREGKVKKVEEVEKEFFGEKKKLIRIITETSKNVPKIREIIKEWPENREEYEYTIPFYQRYLIDKNIRPMNWIEVEGEETKNEKYQIDKVITAKSVKPIDSDKSIPFKILAFDIEIAEVEDKEEIIMISFADNKEFKKLLTTGKIQKPPKWVEILPDEKTMMEKFVQTIKEQDPDFLIGYNSDLFDFMKIKEQADEFRVPLKLGRDGSEARLVRRGRISSTKIRGRVHVDLFSFISHILSPSLKSEVLSLNAVAEELLGLQKKDMKWKDIEKSWREKKGLEKLAEYCLWDSELTLKLSKHLLPQIFSLSRLVGSLPFNSSRYTYSQLVENYLMRKAVETKVLIPNNPKYEEIQKRRTVTYKGGFVKEPLGGIHENIIVYDFTSLYPTIMVSFNMGPSTINCDCCKGDGYKVPDMPYWFCKKRRGFIPRHLEELIKKRKEIKQKMKNIEKNSLERISLNNQQFSLKTICNASYGYTGYFGAKWYSKEVAESISSFGRFFIKKVIRMAEDEGFQVLYADTDSAFVKLAKESIQNKAKEFLEKVNKDLPGIMELDLQGIYKAGIFIKAKTGRTAKKKYALLDQDDNLVIRGMEKVRRDWCELSKRVQEEVLRIILLERNVDKAVKLVRETIKKIQKKKVSLDDLTIYTQLTMPLNEYKSISPHVRVAQKMRERGRPVGEEMIMQYIITDRQGSISEKAEPIEDVKEGEYDADYYINHQVLPAAMRVLQALEITEQQVLFGKVQAKLGKWFTK